MCDKYCIYSLFYVLFTTSIRASYFIHTLIDHRDEIIHLFMQLFIWFNILDLNEVWAHPEDYVLKAFACVHPHTKGDVYATISMSTFILQHL